VFLNKRHSQPAGHVDGWESECIYASAERYFDTLLSDIDGAMHSVAIAVYIFSLDGIGRRLIYALCCAARRGVSVRLVVDGVGSASSGHAIASELTAAGAQVRIFHPLPWYWDSYQWSIKSGSLLYKLTFFFAALNQRDHRKLCIIDNVAAWCGSFNISQLHLDKSAPWRDYGVRVSGKQLTNLTASFDSVWFQQQKKFLHSSLRYFIGNHSITLRRLHNRQLLHRIRSARQRLWICSAYFAPSGSVIRAIKRARNNGVEVRLIVAERSDVALFPMLSSTYYGDLLNMGVSIYCYRAGMLHAKSMLVDRQCVVGSSNLNHRSFYHDLELDLVLSSPRSVAQMRELMLQDMANSNELVRENLSVWRSSTIFGWLIRLVRYWC